MPTDKAWTMNCILTGAAALLKFKLGDEDGARKLLENLTPEFNPEDVTYLLERMRTI